MLVKLLETIENETKAYYVKLLEDMVTNFHLYTKKCHFRGCAAIEYILYKETRTEVVRQCQYMAPCVGCLNIFCDVHLKDKNGKCWECVARDAL